MSCAGWSADGAEAARTASTIHHGGAMTLRTPSLALSTSHLNTPGDSSCRKSTVNGFAPIGTFTWKGWRTDPCETDIGKSQTTKQRKERDMRVSALQRREAGIELSRIAEVYKQFRSDLTDKEALKLAMLGNPDLAEPYLGCPVRWDAVDEVRKFLTNAY